MNDGSAMETALVILFWTCFLLVVYTYIGYGLLLGLLVKIKERFVPRRKRRLPDILPEVTLFVSAYNEEEMVIKKMQNCRSLDYPSDKLKVLWVTDGSTDRTNEILLEFPDARVLFESERKGKTAAINRGMQYVTSPIVIFTDANTMLNRQAIRELVCEFEDPDTGCVAGEKRIASVESVVASSGGEGTYWRYESTLKDLDARLCTAVGAAGELYAIRRDLFEPLPEDTLLDDFMLSMRIAWKGCRIAYCKNAYAIEMASLNMKEEEKRKIRIAAGGIQSVRRLLPLLNIFRHGCLTFQYVSHRVLRWTITPIALFMMIPLNIFLLVWQVNPLSLYLFFALGQLLFYLMALVGWIMSDKTIRHKVLFIPYYFLFMNINVFRGWIYLQRHHGEGVWEKAKRETVS